MKAAIVERPGVLRVGELEVPRCGEYEALCELLYGATCTGTDSHIIDGSFPFSSPLPTILGHESVGRVVELGAKVRNLKIGDIVTRVGTPPPSDGSVSVTWGGFAEYGVACDHQAMREDGVPEELWQPHRWNLVVPTAVDPATAPMFTTWRETLSCLNRMGFVAGNSILIVGSGGNGLSFARHAANLRASVVAMAGAAYVRESAKRKAGVTYYIDYKESDLAGRINAVCSNCFDYIIDAVGKVGVAERVLPCLKPGGSYITYGVDDYGKIVVDASKARGPFTELPCSYDEAETHEQVCELVLQGKLESSLWYDPVRPYPLDEIAEAFESLCRRESPKALIKLND